jgi:antitoxin MazE
MQKSIIQIGNSRGVILPSIVLRRLDLSLKSTVDIVMEDEKIIIRPKPRRGWDEAFKQFALSGAEESFFPDVFEDEDLSDLTWEAK